MATEAREVTRYKITFYGDPIGWVNSRATISLLGPNETLAFVRFHDPGMLFENDYVLNDIIYMNLPSEMFNNVLDVLRNEKPVYIYFIQNKGFLTTYAEDVGEGETIQ